MLKYVFMSESSRFIFMTPNCVRANKFANEIQLQQCPFITYNVLCILNFKILEF